MVRAKRPMDARWQHLSPGSFVTNETLENIGHEKWEDESWEVRCSSWRKWRVILTTIVVLFQSPNETWGQALRRGSNA